MIPNIHIHEQLTHERLQQWQCEAEQEWMLVGLPRHRRLQPLLGRLSDCLVALGTRMNSVSGNSGEIRPFPIAGTYHIYCKVYQGMNLTIIVQ